MQALEGFLSSHQIACEALLVVNDSFREVVLDLIIALATDVADTSELFLRSNQLLRIFEPVVDFSVSRRALRGEPRDADGAEVLRFELDPSPPDAFKAKLLEKRWLE